MSEKQNAIFEIIRIGNKTKRGDIMLNKKRIGRPLKVDYKTMSKLADALSYGSSITEACEYADISRDTFYRYLRDESIFTKKMEHAKTNSQKTKIQ